MSEISTFLESKKPIQGRYKILTVAHPKIEENYGTITIVKVTLDNKAEKPLVVVPGYSNDSFMSGFDVIMKGFDHIKSTFSVMYAFCWGSTIKNLSKDYAAHEKDEEKAFILNEEFRIKLAHILDKILRSPDMDLKNFTILAKSAGAGVSIHIASMNPEVKYLDIACPGTSSRGTPLAKRKDIKIKMMWNKDDDKINYTTSKEFINVFEEQGNDFEFISYDTGGHEFNEIFINIL
jgi:hypothetical protein